MLEVFNTLLKHLRMSVDFELGESSRRNSSTSVSSGRGGKESEERIVQNAIIQTIGMIPVCPLCVLDWYSQAQFSELKCSSGEAQAVCVIVKMKSG